MGRSAQASGRSKKNAMQSRRDIDANDHERVVQLASRANTSRPTRASRKFVLTKLAPEQTGSPVRVGQFCLSERVVARHVPKTGTALAESSAIMLLAQ
eukprot:6195556-Pleurochrysis_carterae.AAC.1